ncbi:hypothetical protein F8388_025570 [Cannabis sativa]|uniref:Uncharacterized protein n=1 Tax=Cannabis sativa TaxID=3483 RepID=A0A7J6G3R8_CANSA|nr:hypothetical protein F8388_025570 [Cannabis sativa]
MEVQALKMKGKGVIFGCEREGFEHRRSIWRKRMRRIGQALKGCKSRGEGRRNGVELESERVVLGKNNG